MEFEYVRTGKFFFRGKSERSEFRGFLAVSIRRGEKKPEVPDRDLVAKGKSARPVNVQSIDEGPVRALEVGYFIVAIGLADDTVPS